MREFKVVCGNNFEPTSRCGQYKGPSPPDETRLFILLLSRSVKSQQAFTQIVEISFRFCFSNVGMGIFGVRDVWVILKCFWVGRRCFCCICCRPCILLVRLYLIQSNLTRNFDRNKLNYQKDLTMYSWPIQIYTWTVTYRLWKCSI